MPTKGSTEEDPEEELDTDGDDLESVEDDEDEVAAGLAMANDDDDEGDDASLEELLAQRASSRRAAGEPEEDDDEALMALSSEREPTGNETIRTKVIPIKDRQEFVCKRCYLVKARSQLADEERVLCRDCV